MSVCRPRRTTRPWLLTRRAARRHRSSPPSRPCRPLLPARHRVATERRVPLTASSRTIRWPFLVFIRRPIRKVRRKPQRTSLLWKRSTFNAIKIWNDSYVYCIISLNCHTLFKLPILVAYKYNVRIFCRISLSSLTTISF